MRGRVIMPGRTSGASVEQRGGSGVGSMRSGVVAPGLRRQPGRIPRRGVQRLGLGSAPRRSIRVPLEAPAARKAPPPEAILSALVRSITADWLTCAVLALLRCVALGCTQAMP